MDTDAPLTDSRVLPAVSNAEIADRLASLAQLLSTQKENPYKVKACRRAASSIRTLSESMRVRNEEALLPDYLAAILRSTLILAQIRHMMTGNTHPRSR
jgi:hypothetical protein